MDSYQWGKAKEKAFQVGKCSMKSRDDKLRRQWIIYTKWEQQKKDENHFLLLLVHYFPFHALPPPIVTYDKIEIFIN